MPVGALSVKALSLRQFARVYGEGKAVTLSIPGTRRPGAGQCGFT